VFENFYRVEGFTIQRFVLSTEVNLRHHGKSPLHVIYILIIQNHPCILQIEMECMQTKKRYVFPCKRWLAKSEDDGCIIRELPASGDDIKKPQPCNILIILVNNYSDFIQQTYYTKSQFYMFMLYSKKERPANIIYWYILTYFSGEVHM